MTTVRITDLPNGPSDEQLTGRTVATIVRRRFDAYTTVEWDGTESTRGTVFRRGITWNANSARGQDGATVVRDRVLARVELLEGRRGR